MRIIDAKTITDAVRQIFLDISCKLADDVATAMESAWQQEKSQRGKTILRQLLDNDRICRKTGDCVCQDTGMSILFVEVGQDVHIEGNFEEAVNQGVREAYTAGYLRKSIVEDPLYERKNTEDNTPAIIHTRLVQGDQIRIEALAKGFGSENMSAIRMMAPSAGEAGVLDFIVQTVKKAGANPCPPIVVGVGIGGDFESVAGLAKRATLRSVFSRSPDERYKQLEIKALQLINKTGIGPGGLGGTVTALAVNVEQAPTHIAGLPVAVNISCHAVRHGSVVI
ncbi:MAG: fumarate hydratase [Saccharofermentanales bacterium]|nr:fumarate hydratase [Clostridiaceae bacterium]